MNEFNYCLGVISMLDVYNLHKGTKKIEKCHLMGKDLKKIMPKLVKKYYELNLYNSIYELFEEFNLKITMFKNDDFLIYAYLRSLSRLKMYKKITELKKNIFVDELKEYKTEIILILSRAFLFENKIEKATEIANKSDEFIGEMMKLFILFKQKKYDILLEKCKILETKYTTLEQQIYLHFWKAEVYHVQNNIEKLKGIIPFITKNIYKSSNPYIPIRCLLLHDFLITLDKKEKAYEYVHYLITHICKTEVELTYKIKAFQILIDEYSFNKEELKNKSLKYDTYENSQILINKLL